MMSVLKGHVDTLFANLCLFLLIEMTLSFLLNLVEWKVTLYLTLNIPCLSAETSQRYCTLRKIKGDLKDLDLFQNKVNAYIPFNRVLMKLIGNGPSNGTWGSILQIDYCNAAALGYILLTWHEVIPCQYCTCLLHRLSDIIALDINQKSYFQSTFTMYSIKVCYETSVENISVSFTILKMFNVSLTTNINWPFVTEN